MKEICRQELLFTNSVFTYVWLVDAHSGHVTCHDYARDAHMVVYNQFATAYAPRDIHVLHLTPLTYL